MSSPWLSVCGAALLLLWPATAKQMYVIDIGHQDSGVSLGDRLAVLACQGLMNRKQETPGEDDSAVYTIKDSWDLKWLDTALEQDPDWEVLSLPSAQFLAEVCAEKNFAKLLYSKERHHEIIPQLITIVSWTRFRSMLNLQ